MLTETYKGRRLRAQRGQQWGTLAVKVNGQLVATLTSRDEAAALAQLRRDIDWIDQEPVNGDRWAAYWYAPGTYQLCPEGLHPVALGGLCQHFTCRRRREETPDGAV